MKDQSGYISFNNINVNHYDSNAGVFIGNNSSNRWNVKEKVNAGFGTTRTNKKSKSPQIYNQNIVHDPDQYDHPRFN
ncbi:hypothetical protein HNQ94_001576 [Salirhabdus euzebyi]|uniref:Uncharacterized protein n=1 Tax=Salirhabdus euzebyi TaxID=394506 RepID=A0A841Q406_9BACI|nr:hypothetical protein [Salirhabdus euzebyi]MBB6453128.1 hypothetical protein [Salirhabdus euzebyi]